MGEPPVPAHRAVDDDLYRSRTVQALSWIGVAACATFAVVNVFRGNAVMIVADSTGAVLLLVNVLGYRRHGNALVATVVGDGALVLLILLGAVQVGPRTLPLLGPVVVVAFFLLGGRHGSMFAVGTLLALFAYLGLWHRGPFPIDTVVSIVVVGLLSRAYERIRVAYGEELRQLSSTDPLTGALNRRSCRALLEEELGRAGRYERPMSVVLFDVDHFKQINDRHGHAAGDRVLRDLVDRVNSAIRLSDALVRWGGEEFLVVLPETPAEGARSTAERIRRLVAAEPVGPGIEATISAGVATRRPGDGVESLIERADERLYQAKRAGRDQVCGGEPAGRRSPGPRSSGGLLNPGPAAPGAAVN